MDPRAEIRLASNASENHYTDKIRILNGAQKDLPSAALGQLGGGDIVIDPSDKTGTKAQVGEFELQALFSNTEQAYQPGQTAHVRLKLTKRPLIVQWSRKFMQLVQERQSSKWL